MSEVSLSVVVISHNQKQVLRRCLDSILSQETSFPVQVIVSDDRSNDGTREMLLSEYKEKVISTFFDSNEYETSYVLERAALNRINGLKLATGKYLIHIDGDDFFIDKLSFQTMVDKLETHLDCNLCCQNYCILPSDNLDAPPQPFCDSTLFISESILSVDDFFSQIGLIHNSCFCMRRTATVKVEDLTSTTYDDIDITIRYMGNANIALVNRCGFVYVQYPDSSCSTMTKQEKRIVFMSGVSAILLAPSLTGIILNHNMWAITRIAYEAIKRKQFSERMISYCHKIDMFLFRGLSNDIPIKDWFRFLLIFTCSAFMWIFHVRNKMILKFIYKLVVDSKIPKNVII